jgi:hypothetical protein
VPIEPKFVSFGETGPRVVDDAIAHELQNNGAATPARPNILKIAQRNITPELHRLPQ